MEYLYAFLILIGICFLTTISTGIFKILVPIAYIGLGYYLGTESLILGIGASLGAVINIGIVNRYLKTEGAMSSAPLYSKLASYGLIIAFILVLFLKDSTEFNFDSGNGWYVLIAVAVIIIGIRFFLAKRRNNSRPRSNGRVVFGASFNA